MRGYSLPIPFQFFTSSTFLYILITLDIVHLSSEQKNRYSYAVDFNSAEFNLPSGIYFYTLSAGEFKETRKMVLVK